ncbi:MAG: sugar phosphate isomerase/epimerase [Planctomycetota bacterium]
MPPKLAFSANAFKKTSFTVAASEIAAIGYSAIEIFADYPHFYPLETPVETQLEILRLLQEMELKVSNVNAFTMYRVKDTWRPSFIDPEAVLRQKRLDHTVAAMEMASRLKCPTVSTEPGGPLDAGQTREEAMAMFLDGLAEVLDRTSHLDTLLLIEPEPGLLLQTTADAQDFLDRVTDPRIAINFDAGHFFCVGEDPAEAVHKLAGRFDHVHIEDIAESRKHVHLVPGDGAMDFRALFRALADIGYDGFVTVELYPFEDKPAQVAERAMEYLGPIWLDVFGKDPAE